MATVKFYKPQMYVASYKTDGTIDTDSVIAIEPSRFTSDGVTASFTPKTYDDETPEGTFTYDMGITEGNTLSGAIKFLNMYELASLANGGTPNSDKTHGLIEFGKPGACATVEDRAVVVIDLCDTVNTDKMWKIDHCDFMLMNEDFTMGGSDPLEVSFQINAHPGGETPVATFGYDDPTKVFDPTTWSFTSAS